LPLRTKTASRAFLVEGNLVICNDFGGLPLLLPTAINMIKDYRSNPSKQSFIMLASNCVQAQTSRLSFIIRQDVTLRGVWRLEVFQGRVHRSRQLLDLQPERLQPAENKANMFSQEMFRPKH